MPLSCLYSKYEATTSSRSAQLTNQHIKEIIESGQKKIAWHIIPIIWRLYILIFVRIKQKRHNMLTREL